MRKKGVSPVIATVMLISLVIILGLIIFLWARGFVTEQAQKFGSSVEFACEQVVFEAAFFDGSTTTSGFDEIDVINRGNVPIYGVDIKQRSVGEILVHVVSDTTLGIGDSDSYNVDFIQAQIGDELNVVPLILGETSSGTVVHTCEDQYGYAIAIV